MRTQIMMLFIFCASCLSGFSQTMFQRHYGGTLNEKGYCVIQSSDGGYIVAGVSDASGIYLIKTNNIGAVQWTKNYCGNFGGIAYSLISTSDNCYIIAGQISGFGAGLSDAFLMKVDSYGDSLWFRTYGGYLEDGALSVIESPDNGFLITGHTRSFSTGFSAFYAVKTDTTGDIQWTKIFENDYMNGAYAAIQTFDSGYLIVGGTGDVGGATTEDGFVVRTDLNGDSIWTKTYGGNSFDRFTSACKTPDSNYLLCGTTWSYGAGKYDIFLLKINPGGGEIWRKTIGSIESENGNGIIQTTDGGYAITGSTQSFGAGGMDVFLVKLDSDGDTIWTRTFGGYNDDWANSVQQTTDGGFIITGTTNSFGGNIDIYLVKTDANGVSGFEKTIPIRTSLKVYPNPSDGLFTIQWSDVSDKNKIVQIFNLQGQEVYKKSITEEAANKTLIDLSDCSRGMYIIRFSDEKSITNSKIIIY